MKPNSPIVITGGGTGGHITPALAVAEELVALGHRVVFIGSMTGPEKELVEEAGYTFYGIQTGKLRRYLDWQNIADLFRVTIGFWQARNRLARLKPQAVFSKGGYVSVPVVYAAAFLEIPLVIHESDVVMGLANQLAAPKAELIATGYPIENYPDSLKDRLRFTGNPVRSIFSSSLKNRRQVLLDHQLALTRPLILVMGGSQGALAINRLIYDSLPTLLNNLQIIHLTGVNNIEEAEQVKASLPNKLAKHYHPFGYVRDELPSYIQLADIVVSRASSGSLSELALLGKPTILLPLSTSAAGHQQANAEALARKGAALVLDETKITAPQLAKAIIELVADTERCQELARAIRSFSSPQAARLIAELVDSRAKRATKK